MKAKKLLVLMLAVILVLSTASFAAAETLTAVPGSKEITVYGVYSGGGTTTTVYSVDVTWGEMTFTYTEKDLKVWDPKTHTYTTASGNSWTGTGNSITVTNHSNAAVQVNFEFEAAQGSGIAGHFTEPKKELKSAAEVAEGNPQLAPTVDSTLIIDSGTLPNTATGREQIGTVSVNLSAVTTEP